MLSKIIPPDVLPTYGIDLSDRHRKRLEDVGAFPRRVQMTAKRHGYVLAEIIAYQDQRIAMRDAAA